MRIPRIKRRMGRPRRSWRPAVRRTTGASTRCSAGSGGPAIGAALHRNSAWHGRGARGCRRGHRNPTRDSAGRRLMQERGLGPSPRARRRPSSPTPRLGAESSPMAGRWPASKPKGKRTPSPRTARARAPTSPTAAALASMRWPPDAGRVPSAGSLRQGSARAPGHARARRAPGRRRMGGADHARPRDPLRSDPRGEAYLRGARDSQKRRPMPLHASAAYRAGYRDGESAPDDANEAPPAA
jgi:hypothetical protein